MKYLLMYVNFIVGAIIPVQAIVNARLGKQVGGALMGSLMSFFTGFVCLLILNLIINQNAFSLNKVFFSLSMVCMGWMIDRCSFRKLYYMDKSTARCCINICIGYKRPAFYFFTDWQLWMVWFSNQNNNFRKNYWCSIDYRRYNSY